MWIPQRLGSQTVKALLRPRWVLVHVIVATAVALFAVAGFWQLRRLSERRAHNAFVAEQRERPPVDLTASSGDAEDILQRRVRAAGRYDTAREVVLHGRGGGGRPGNHLLTPLVLPDGRAVLVDRGWVPLDVDTPGDARVAAPSGRVEVTGVLLASEGSGPLATTARVRDLAAVSRIDVGRIMGGMGERALPHYLLLSTQDPPPTRGVPDPVDSPALDEGSHLIYAGQWFLFIPVALIGYGAILRRELRRGRAHAAS